MQARRKIFLHIGMHKTGTTAFQSFCASHTEQLKQQGFLYPETGRPRVRDVSYGHHLLPWSLTRHVTSPEFWPEGIEHLTDIWGRLKKEIDSSDCPNAILTSEEFDTLSENQTRFVCTMLSEFEVCPIIFLRRLDEFVQGMYTTDVIHNGEARTLADYRPRIRTPVDYLQIVGRWVHAANGAVTVRVYSPETSRNASIVADLASTIGIDLNAIEKSTAPERLNVSCWPWYVVEICRQLNACQTPQDLVVKFAYIMRGIVGQVDQYDLMLPSEMRLLVHQSLESVERLKSENLIAEIPQSFGEIKAQHTDERWLEIHQGDYGALTRVLQQVSRLVDKPPSS